MVGCEQMLIDCYVDACWRKVPDNMAGGIPGLEVAAGWQYNRHVAVGRVGIDGFQEQI